MRKLPDSELEIMLIIWELDRPVTRFEIEDKLAADRMLSPTTVLSFLSRLQEKGFLSVKKDGKNNIYSAVIDRQSYMRAESKNILRKLYKNSVKNFLTALYDGEELSEEELRELEEYIAAKRNGQ